MKNEFFFLLGLLWLILLYFGAFTIQELSAGTGIIAGCAILGIVQIEFTLYKTKLKIDLHNNALLNSEKSEEQTTEIKN